MIDKNVLVGATLVLLVASGFVYWEDNHSAAPEFSASGESSGNETTAPASPQKQTPEQRYIDQLAVEILQAYGDSIDNKATQAALFKMRTRVLSAHPDQGERLFKRAVYTAFPDLAKTILQTVATMARYQDWLADNRLDLNDMPLLQRQGLLWQKRRALFGDDAEIIWAEEKQAHIAKREAMQETYKRLDQSNGTLDEHLFQLEEAIVDTYGYGIKSAAIDSGSVAQAYFGFESVQEHLRELPADARQQEINRLRKQMGYTSAQIERLAERDQEREQRWQRGENYMNRRDSLSQRYTGAELEQKLDALRDDIFAHEARTIALEERDGFFRYERRRLFGRN